MKSPACFQDPLIEGLAADADSVDAGSRQVLNSSAVENVLGVGLAGDAAALGEVRRRFQREDDPSNFVGRERSRGAASQVEALDASVSEDISGLIDPDLFEKALQIPLLDVFVGFLGKGIAEYAFR
jgi:hypothetical protein